VTFGKRLGREGRCATTRAMTLRRREAWRMVGMIAAAVPACDAALGIREYDAPVGAEAGGPEAGDASGEAGVDGGGAGSITCGLPAGAQACAACVQAQCCTQAEACAGNSACASYEGCLLGCGGDYACRSRCLIADFGNAPEIPEMDQCVSAQCGTACRLTCGSTSTYAEPDAAAACAQCITSNNCTAAAACGGSLGCQQVAECGLGCTTEDCAHACVELSDAGGAAFLTYGDGMLTCIAPCALGSFWDCPPSSPPPSSVSETTITLNFVSLPTGAAVAGATVKACGVPDTACAAPVVAPGRTDADGNVTFVLPRVGPFGFGGYFDISGPTIYPSLYFLRHPLSVARVTFPQVYLPEPSRIGDLYAALKATPNTTRGVIEVTATDCHWTPAPHVTAHASFPDGGLDFAYFTNAAPDPDPAATSTDAFGAAVLINAPTDSAATISVTSLVHPSTRSTATLFARAGAWSFMLVRP
jgi:hypothetical protein